MQTALLGKLVIHWYHIDYNGDVVYDEVNKVFMKFNPHLEEKKVVLLSDKKIREEISKALVWISFPNLPPKLFAKQFLLSIAPAAVKPMATDKATLEKSKPSTARVKVELDLLAKLPQQMKLQYVDEKSAKITDHFQKFVYDNLSSCCTFYDAREILDAKRSGKELIQVVNKDQLVVDHQANFVQQNPQQQLDVVTRDVLQSDSIVALAIGSHTNGVQIGKELILARPDDLGDGQRDRVSMVVASPGERVGEEQGSLVDASVINQALVALSVLKNSGQREHQSENWTVATRKNSPGVRIDSPIRNTMQ
ncbi:hypothetical protein FXO37_17882 [Capsicum annuum]|nr:hypothetical protein FXO37_17882 [Capsicum annuum]